MKKNTTRIGVLLCTVMTLLFLSSCATSPSEKTEQQNATDTLKKIKSLQKNELYVLTKNIPNALYMNMSASAQISAFTDFLDEIKGHVDFTIDEKYALLNALFNDLPISGEDGVVREVYVGSYFKDGSPLEIRIGTFSPNPDAVIKTEKIILILTNIVKQYSEKDNTTTLIKDMGMFIDLEKNACIAVLLNTPHVMNLLANTSYMGATQEAFTEIKKDPLSAIMVCQILLRDFDMANDEFVPPMMNPITSNADIMPAFKIMAMLQLYNYYIAKEDIANAETQWQAILNYAPSVPGDMTAKNLEIINGANLRLLKMLTQ